MTTEQVRSMSVVSNIFPERDRLPRAAAPAHPVGPDFHWYLPLKTFAEFVIAAILLIVTAPLLLLAVVLVKLTSPGPAFYSQTRVGRGGRPFTIYKVRTMAYQCESLTGPCWSKPGDTRVTAVGRWLRRSHLDELPQLWNVLQGEMSLIGPRPERPEFVPQLEQAIPLYHARLQVRPGLSGLAQVQLPPDSDLASVRVKLAYDLHYVQNVSFLLDVRLYLATGFHLLGLPFSLVRKLLGFPEKETIEGAYHNLVGRPALKVNSNGHASKPSPVAPPRLAEARGSTNRS
jgi:lipopolysaccharide/colanic/teichoic acid biosynthesis glycosyltransferase